MTCAQNTTSKALGQHSCADWPGLVQCGALCFVSIHSEAAHLVSEHVQSFPLFPALLFILRECKVAHAKLPRLWQKPSEERFSSVNFTTESLNSKCLQAGFGHYVMLTLAPDILVMEWPDRPLHRLLLLPLPLLPLQLPTHVLWQQRLLSRGASVGNNNIQQSCIPNTDTKIESSKMPQPASFNCFYLWDIYPFPFRFWSSFWNSGRSFFMHLRDRPKAST